MSNFSNEFFKPKEVVKQTEPPMRGNYEPDPQYKKLYVVIAGEAYESNFKLLTAVADEATAKVLEKRADAAIERYKQGCTTLKSIAMHSKETTDKLLELLKAELSAFGLGKALELTTPDYLYFEVQEVTAKVN